MHRGIRTLIPSDSVSPIEKLSILRPLFMTTKFLLILSLFAAPAAFASSLAPNEVAFESLSSTSQMQLRRAEMEAENNGLFEGGIVFGLKTDMNVTLLHFKGKVLGVYDIRTKKFGFYFANGVGSALPLNVKEILHGTGDYAGLDVGVSLGYLGGSQYSTENLATAITHTAYPHSGVGTFGGGGVGYAKGFGGSGEFYCSYVYGCKLWLVLLSVEYGLDQKFGLYGIDFHPLFQKTPEQR